MKVRVIFLVLSFLTLSAAYAEPKKVDQSKTIVYEGRVSPLTKDVNVRVEISEGIAKIKWNSQIFETTYVSGEPLIFFTDPKRGAVSVSLGYRNSKYELQSFTMQRFDSEREEVHEIKYYLGFTVSETSELRTYNVGNSSRSEVKIDYYLTSPPEGKSEPILRQITKQTNEYSALPFHQKSTFDSDFFVYDNNWKLLVNTKIYTTNEPEKSSTRVGYSFDSYNKSRTESSVEFSDGIPAAFSSLLLDVVTMGDIKLLNRIMKVQKISYFSSPFSRFAVSSPLITMELFNDGGDGKFIPKLYRARAFPGVYVIRGLPDFLVRTMRDQSDLYINYPSPDYYKKLIGYDVEYTNSTGDNYSNYDAKYRLYFTRQDGGKKESVGIDYPQETTVELGQKKFYISQDRKGTLVFTESLK